MGPFVGQQLICNILLQLERFVPRQASLPISLVTEKPSVQSKMIKAVETELPTKNFRPDQGRENKTPTKHRTQGAYDQNIQVFSKSWKIQLSSLQHVRKNWHNLLMHSYFFCGRSSSRDPKREPLKSFMYCTQNVRSIRKLKKQRFLGPAFLVHN